VLRQKPERRCVRISAFTVARNSISERQLAERAWRFGQSPCSRGVDAQTGRGSGFADSAGFPFHSLHSFNSEMASVGIPQETRMKLRGIAAWR
jgi:hypothetical protein